MQLAASPTLMWCASSRDRAKTTRMQAEELKSLLDSAGIPAHCILEDDFIEWPDPEEFDENITVWGIDKGPLKFKLPNVSEIDIVGIEEVKEELISFPPFADLKDLLQPIRIPSEYLPKDSPSSCAIRQELTQTDQTVDSVPRAGSSQQVSSLPLQLPIKREREPDNETEPSAQINKILLTADDPVVRNEEESPMDQDIILSNSVEIVEPESDDSVIDLTQDT